MPADFYSLESSQAKEGEILAEIRIDAGHAIFDGHFPGMPVLPGVLMLQLFRDILSSGLGESLHLAKAQHIKYLSPLLPDERLLQVEISYSREPAGILANATLSYGTDTFCKLLKGTFVADL